MVIGGFAEYKTKEIVWTKVLVDLVGNVCSFSESTVSSDSILRFRQFIWHSLHVRMITLAMRLCTQNVATPTTILNFRDQKSNHEIHENIVPRKFGAIR